MSSLRDYIRTNLQRIALAALLIFTTAGSIYLLYAVPKFDNFDYLLSRLNRSGSLDLIALLLPVGIAASYAFGRIIKYLDPQKDKERRQTSVSNEIKEVIGTPALRQEIKELRMMLEARGHAQSGTVPVDSKQIVEMLRPTIIAKLEQGIFQSVDEEFAKRDLERREQERRIADFDAIHKRLDYETEKLARRSNLNLILGILITLVAGAGLVYIVFMHPLELGPNPDEHKWRIVAHYIPRLSLIVFAQIFAYFFLRLYKTGLADIKYYQNEITNIDLKLMALKAALVSPDPKDLGQVIRDLSRTERNFVLKRGETTVELEMFKADGTAGRDLVKQIASYVRTNGKES